jgi:hypothetical protein
LDVYDDKLLKSAQKHPSITWGNDFFTVQSLKVISEITQADGHLTAASWLAQKDKDLIQGRLHSKILASLILSMLSDDARQVIECQLDIYSWTDLGWT